jgi:hypothetical protein
LAVVGFSPKNPLTSQPPDGDLSQPNRQSGIYLIKPSGKTLLPTIMTHQLGLVNKLGFILALARTRLARKKTQPYLL